MLYFALFCFVTHYDVSCFDELQPGLPNHDVDKVHKVTEHIKNDPVHVDSLVVVREGQPCGAEPGVIVVGQSHQGQPDDIPFICREDTH